MLYDEIGAGGTRSGGCVVVEVLYCTATLYGIGDTLYNIAKARRGKLEKIVIKGVRKVSFRKNYGANRVIYQDTFNGLWNEHDLVPYEKAVELIQTHSDAVETDRRRLGSC